MFVVPDDTATCRIGSGNLGIVGMVATPDDVSAMTLGFLSKVVLLLSLVFFPLLAVLLPFLRCLLVAVGGDAASPALVLLATVVTQFSTSPC